MFRNTGLRQLAAITALVINVLVFLLLTVTGSINFDAPFNLVMIFFISTMLSFFIARYIIVEVVYNRVKPLYKVIKNIKSPIADIDRGIMSDDVLDKVEQDVNQWAMETKEEMETLKSLENYRREYISNVSHELKTPIFNIQGFAHTLMDGAMYDKKYLKTFIKRTAINAERLITIVEDLDTINRIESNALTLENEKFPLQELVLDVIDELKEMAESRKITIMIKEGIKKSFNVRADRRCIHQVLSNLINNSIKYGKENGETKIGFYDMDNYILIEVTDDGIGMEAHHLKHVFDRFYRIDKSRSRVRDSVGGGSGLGLAIVKHLIDAHDQTITVRSTPEIGSTFGFTLEKA